MVRPSNTVAPSFSSLLIRREPSVKVLDVFQLTAYIKDLIETDPMLEDVWVRGEITSLSRSAAGHIYFNLSTDGSQLQCALFRNNQRGLLTQPRSGESVLAHGHVSVYESRGAYQLIVDNVAPEGVGILQLQFEEMRRRLEAEGLFRPERKRPLPLFPTVIGVVTSPAGAVWHDIQTIAARRYPLVELRLAPSIVQGPDAPTALCAALTTLNDESDVDIIILARGGGSPEDLACFNDERLARTIFASRAPVVSAVGHETDVSIADLVADVRVATPSAAAEICLPDQAELREALLMLTAAARSATLQRVGLARESLMHQQQRVVRRDPQRTIDRFRQDVDWLATRSSNATHERLESRRQRVLNLAEASRHLDPRAILARGYAFVATASTSGSRVTSASDARLAGDLSLAFADGSVDVTVTKGTS